MKSPFPFPGTLQQHLQHLSKFGRGDLLVIFLDMTMVCSDCMPAGTQARAGMALENQVSWQLPMCVGKPAFLMGNTKTPKTSQRIWERSTRRQTQD